MNPFKPHDTHRVVTTLPEAEISNTEVLRSPGTTSTSLTFPSKTTLARRAGVALFISLGICWLLGSHRAAAQVVAQASLSSAGSPASIAWRPCGKQLDCARVPVPLDWDHPDGPQISLLVIRHHASKPNERIGSLFVNFGGSLCASGRGRLGPVGRGAV